MNQYTSQSVTYGRAFSNSMLTAMKTAPGGALIVGAKLRLSKDPAFNPTPDSTITALAANEGDFSGYTAGGNALTLTGSGNSSNVCQVEYAASTFLAAPAGTFIPNDCTGYWIDDGTNLIAGERFADAAVFSAAAPGDFLQVDLRLPMQLVQDTQ